MFLLLKCKYSESQGCVDGVSLWMWNDNNPLRYELMTSVKLDITARWHITPQAKGDKFVFTNTKGK